jgi:hypothetical protein
MIELTKGPSAMWRNQMDHSKPNILQPLAEDYKIAEFLHARGGDWRVETDLPYNFGPWWGVETVDGLVAAVTSNFFDQDFISPRFRELMSVRFRVAEKPLRDDQKVVFEGARGVKIFENPKWLPRTWVVHDEAVEPNARAMRDRLTSSTFNPRQQVLLHEKGPGLESCGGDLSELGRRTPGRVEVKVDANCRGMLISNDVFYPGWYATVDGVTRPIYEAYGVVRGVVVDKGKHTVVFEYRPWSVKVGVLLSLLGLVGVVVVTRRREMGA